MNAVSSIPGIFEDARAWEKLPQETSQAFCYFQHYRDQGPERTFEATAASKMVRASLLSGLAKRYHWQSRAEQWDQFLDRKRQEKRLREATEMDERHALLAMMMQEKVALRLESMSEADLLLLSPGDLAKWLATSTRVERDARAVVLPPPGLGTTVNVNAVSSSRSRSEAVAAAEATTVHVTETIVRTREDVSSARQTPKGEIIDGE